MIRAAAPLRLALFDCDGTLVDSQFAIIATMGDAFAEHGLEPPDAAAVRALIGLPLVEAIGRLLPDRAGTIHATLAGAYRAAFARRRREGEDLEPLFPGMRDALDALERAGILLGVATGKSDRGLRAVLAAHGLTERFVTLQTADHGPGKPHPAMVHRALAEAGVDAADTVMIGDTTFDMQMARAARVAGLGVAWGYHAAGELERAGAARIVADASEMTDAIMMLLGVGNDGAMPA